MNKRAPATKLAEQRALLDAVDRGILDALRERQAIVDEIAAAKAEGEAALHDPAREEELLEKLDAEAHARGLNRHFVRGLYRQILQHSVRVQQHHLVDLRNPAERAQRKVCVAFQGAEGSYSQMAAEHHFAPWQGQIETHGYESFAAMLEAVRAGTAEYGVLPIENTTAGSINEAYDLLAGTTLSAVGEELLRVEHCLVALPGASLDGIRRVYSHPQALAQCTRFLAGLRDCAVESFTDTAMSVAKVKADGDPRQAAIASERAAAIHGLAVLARNLENQEGNFTRFLVVARQPLKFDERIPCKTSLIFATRHERGALVTCLNLLADRGLSLTKLESRPRPNTPWEYLFYVDFEGNVASEPVQEALERIRAHTSFLKLLGSYPARTTGAA